MATLQHTDELYHILEDEICALKILPGEALSENQLCKRFGVSRTPIRSVLQRLEQNRFVQIIPCKGTIVTAIDTGVVDQLIFQRVAVEGMVFRDFVQSCSPMEILAVEHLYNMLLEAAAGRSDPENFDFNHFLSCDLAMHEYWFRKTSKEYLWEQMTRPQADYSRFIRLDIVGARNVSSVVSEHAEMLRILREKDLDAIEPLMRTPPIRRREPHGQQGLLGRIPRLLQAARGQIIKRSLHSLLYNGLFLVAPAGVEPTMGESKSPALPLGDGASCKIV